jgi:hypothetical protein
MAMGGPRPRRLTGRREGLLVRIAEKPDLTLRAMVAELAAAGVTVSYGAVWAFFALGASAVPGCPISIAAGGSAVAIPIAPTTSIPT